MRKHRTALLLICLLAAALADFAPWLQQELEAAAVLERISGNPAHKTLAHFREHPVRESAADYDGIHARLYLPADISDPAGMVVVHGVHHLGIEEPRLIAFSRAMASSGIAVLTPELPGIADYHVTRESIDVIGDAAHHMRELQNGRIPGVLGLSFSGGLALIAADDRRYAKDIGFVAAVGAHDDMQRVARFYVTDEAPEPNGGHLHMKAHDYGALVIVYSHIERFFAPADQNAAREALRLLLYERVDEAKQHESALSPAGRERMEKLFAHDGSAISNDLLAEVEQDGKEYAAVSPHAHLAHLHVPVLLLHGAGDSVIPPSETEWLAQDIPEGLVRAELVSRAISHVNMDKSPGLREELALINWMRLLLEEARTPR